MADKDFGLVQRTCAEAENLSTLCGREWKERTSSPLLFEKPTTVDATTARRYGENVTKRWSAAWPRLPTASIEEPAMRFRENDTVRLTDAITARPSFGELDEVHLRRGQLGAVIDTLGDCGAYEVEFILQKPVFGTDGSLIDVGKFCVVTLKEHQIEPDYGSALGDESD